MTAGRRALRRGAVRGPSPPLARRPAACRCSGGEEGASPSLCALNPSVDLSFQEASSRLSSHIPLIIQFFVLQSFGQQLQKSMLQLLQDKESYGMLLRERSDTSDRRKFLKERLSRLTKARHRLAQFPA